MEAGGHCLVGLSIFCQKVRVTCQQQIEDIQRRIAEMQGQEPPAHQSTSAYSTLPADAGEDFSIDGGEFAIGEEEPGEEAETEANMAL